jgi:gamma-butyrobetaine dioxygenase
VVESFSFDSDGLDIVCPCGRRDRFAAIWLRDNDPANRDLRTGQRLTDITVLPERPRIASVQLQNGTFCIEWLDGGRTTTPFANLRAIPPSPDPERALWTSAAAHSLIWEDHDSITASRSARLEWLKAIARDGIAFLRNVSGSVETLASLVGYIRETNFGRIFDVRALPDPNNLAYTDRGLGLHTDNPYREPVPGIQILHCLQASGEGGDSIFADGFAAAEHLRETDAGAFRMLHSTPVDFEFRDANVHLRATRPLIELDHERKLRAVHYNNRSIAPLRLPYDQVCEFYGAYRAFASLIKNARFPHMVKLSAGDAVAFDNQRVLHGRTPYAADRYARWLQGCYVDRDGLYSNIAVLSRNVD